ncbi:hypothetical protein FDC52_18010, partial [Clostridium botulinum]|nr:hypothetical protein [Clostridium botulinum]NFN63464.1 hypothetical protein [Clostridium botulinum]NFO89478.1 hypothetical protein [Clostridium botulinum]
MKRKLIASMLVAATVVGVIPTEGVMAATTVSTVTSSVRVKENYTAGYRKLDNVKDGDDGLYCNGAKIPETYTGSGIYFSTISAPAGSIVKVKACKSKQLSTNKENNHVSAYLGTPQNCIIKERATGGITITESSQAGAYEATATLTIVMPKEGTKCTYSYSGDSKRGTRYLTFVAFSEGESQDLKPLVKSSLLDFTPNNNTSKQDIENFINSSVEHDSNSKIEVKEFNKINSTEKKAGKVTGKIQIYNSINSQYEYLDYDLIIPQLAPSTNSASPLIEATLKNFKVTNKTTKEDIISSLNELVDTSIVKINIDNFNKINSTEISKGKITGIIKINDGKTEKTINLNQEVEQLDQSIETVEKLFKNYLDKINATNETTKEDILKGVLITNENIKAQIVDYNKVDSTDLKEGSIKGKLIINSRSATKEIPIDLIISKLAQSSINAKDNIDNTLKNIKVTNETIKEDILNAIKVGVDTETVKITIENFNKIDSTEINKGKITGIIKINDGKTEETINLNQEVEQLDQSIETVEKLFKNYLDKINATNETTKEDILKGVLITNENIKAQIVDYNKVDSTDLKEGSIKGKLIINSGSTTKEIPIDLIISKLAQSSISAKDNIDNTLKNIKVTNETTKEGILNAIKVGVDTEAVKITIENFNKIDSTEINKGKITGIVKINDGKTEETIPVNLIIDQLNQSVSTIKKLLNKSISDFIATNQTIEKDILDSIYVANEDIKVKIEDFKKTNATDTSKGKITGNIIITDGTNTEEIKLDKTIDYLPQELDTAIHLVQNVINNTKADNSTSFKEILNKCNEVITNPKIKIYVEPSSANNVKATEFKEGGLTGTIIISNGSKDIEVPINLTIDRLPQTLPGAKENIEASLKEFDVTNDTKEEDVLKAIETNIRDKNISIKFGTEDNERFSKENATEFKDGSIKGQIIVSNGTDTVQVPVDLNIKKLPQTLPGAKENIEASLKEFDVTNDTKEEDVLKAIETNIRDKN